MLILVTARNHTSKSSLCFPHSVSLNNISATTYANQKIFVQDSFRVVCVSCGEKMNKVRTYQFKFCLQP